MAPIRPAPLLDPDALRHITSAHNAVVLQAVLASGTPVGLLRRSKHVQEWVGLDEGIDRGSVDLGCRLHDLEIPRYIFFVLFSNGVKGFLLHLFSKRVRRGGWKKTYLPQTSRTERPILGVNWANAIQEKRAERGFINYGRSIKVALAKEVCVLFFFFCP